MRRPSIFAEEQTNTNRYSDSFYPYCIKAWNNLDPTIRNLPDISHFKKALQQLIRPKKRYLSGMNDRVGLNLLTRLRVDFSDLKVIGIRSLTPAQNSVSLKLMQRKTLNFVINLPDVEHITK